MLGIIQFVLVISAAVFSVYEMQSFGDFPDWPFNSRSLVAKIQNQRRRPQIYQLKSLQEQAAQAIQPADFAGLLEIPLPPSILRQVIANWIAVDITSLEKWLCADPTARQYFQAEEDYFSNKFTKAKLAYVISILPWSLPLFPHRQLDILAYNVFPWNFIEIHTFNVRTRFFTFTEVCASCHKIIAKRAYLFGELESSERQVQEFVRAHNCVIPDVIANMHYYCSLCRVTPLYTLSLKQYPPAWA